MKGCSSLSDEEIDRIRKIGFSGKYEKRNILMFELLLVTGFRISEFLSLKMKDVYDFEDKKSLEQIELKKRNTKGKRCSRISPLGDKIRKCIEEYINSVPEKFLHPRFPLIYSNKKVDEHKPLRRDSCYHMFKKIFKKCGIRRKVGCHTTRKTFAKKIYEKSGNDLMLCQKALGHSRLDSTSKYLQTNDDFLNKIMIQLGSEPIPEI